MICSNDIIGVDAQLPPQWTNHSAAKEDVGDGFFLWVAHSAASVNVDTNVVKVIMAVNYAIVAWIHDKIIRLGCCLNIIPFFNLSTKYLEKEKEKD